MDASSARVGAMYASPQTQNLRDDEDPARTRAASDLGRPSTLRSTTGLLGRPGSGHSSLVPRRSVLPPHVDVAQLSDDECLRACEEDDAAAASESDDELHILLDPPLPVLRQASLLPLEAAVACANSADDLHQLIEQAHQLHEAARHNHPVALRDEFALEFITPGLFSTYRPMLQVMADLERAAAAWELAHDHFSAARQLAARFVEPGHALEQGLEAVARQCLAQMCLQDLKRELLNAWRGWMNGAAPATRQRILNEQMRMQMQMDWSGTDSREDIGSEEGEQCNGSSLWTVDVRLADLSAPLVYRASVNRFREAMLAYDRYRSAALPSGHEAVPGFDVALLDVRRFIEKLRAAERNGLQGGAPNPLDDHAQALAHRERLERARDELIDVTQTLRLALEGRQHAPESMAASRHQEAMAQGEIDVSKTDELARGMQAMALGEGVNTEARDVDVADHVVQLSRHFMREQATTNVLKQKLRAPFSALATQLARAQNQCEQAASVVMESPGCSVHADVFRAWQNVVLAADACVEGLKGLAPETLGQDVDERAMGAMVQALESDAAKALTQAVSALEQGLVRQAVLAEPGQAIGRLDRWRDMILASPLLARMRQCDARVDQCLLDCDFHILMRQCQTVDHSLHATDMAQTLHLKASDPSMGLSMARRYQGLRSAMLTKAVDLFEQDVTGLCERLKDVMNEGFVGGMMASLTLPTMWLPDALPEIRPLRCVPLGEPAAAPSDQYDAHIGALAMAANYARQQRTAMTALPEDASLLLLDRMCLQQLKLHNLEMGAKGRVTLLECGAALRRLSALATVAERAASLEQISGKLDTAARSFAQALQQHENAVHRGASSAPQGGLKEALELVGWELRYMKRTLRGMRACASALHKVHLAYIDAQAMHQTLKHRALNFTVLEQRIDPHHVNTSWDVMNAFLDLKAQALADVTAQPDPTAGVQEVSELDALKNGLAMRVQHDFNVLTSKLYVACVRSELRETPTGARAMPDEVMRVTLDASLREQLTLMSQRCLKHQGDKDFVRHVVASNANCLRLLDELEGELHTARASQPSNAASDRAQAVGMASAQKTEPGKSKRQDKTKRR